MTTGIVFVIPGDEKGTSLKNDNIEHRTPNMERRMWKRQPGHPWSFESL